MLAAIMNSNYEYSGVWTPLTVWVAWSWKLEQSRTGISEARCKFGILTVFPL